MKFRRLLFFYFIPLSSLTIASVVNAQPVERVNLDRSSLRLAQALEEQIIITGIDFQDTDDGLQIILQSSQKERIQPLIFPNNGKLIIEINNAQLDLPEGSPLIQVDPNPAISQIAIENVDTNIVRIIVTGKENLPQANIIPSQDDFVLSISQRESRTSSSEEIEIFVTQDDSSNTYFVPSSSTVTGTQTPLLDIPQSIQVVPQKLIDDRNARELGDVLETIPGVVSGSGRGVSVFGPGFIIRGFPTNGSIFRDGIPYFTLSPIVTSDIETIEVLKGPASIMFGAGEPGGIINLTSKKPTDEPFYEFSFTAGNFNTYQVNADLSAPINEDKTLKYRLNFSYENFESFRDFLNGEQVVVSPILNWQIGERTNLNIYGQYIGTRETLDEGLPANSQGNIVDVSRERFLGEDFSRFEQDQYMVGYNFKHEFSDNWSVRHNLQYLKYKPLRFAPLSDFFDDTTGELFRIAYSADGTYDRFFTDLEFVGNFYTEAVKHKLYTGVEFRRNTETPGFQFNDIYPPINVFNPIYIGQRFERETQFLRDDEETRFAFYLQDQIDLFDNLKLLAGFRYDYVEQNRSEQFVGDIREEFNQEDEAISPRIGLIYQPASNVSLYASYTASFNPSLSVIRNGDGSAFDPEIGEQWELGVKADLSERLSLTAAIFDITKENIAVEDPDDRFSSIQTGEQTSRGFEIFLGGEILPGWNISTGYTYLDAFVSKDTTDLEDNRLPNVPANQFSLWTSYEVQEGDLQGFGIGLGLFYVDSREGDISNSYSIPSYFRTDMALYYKRENWDVQLNIENLFDNEYFVDADEFINASPGAPFTVSGKFSVRF